MTKTLGKNDRDERGLWQEGCESPNPAGRNGKEFHLKAKELRALLQKKLANDFPNFLDTLFQQHYIGNMQAARIICDYGLGRFTESIGMDDNSVELPEYQTKEAREKAEEVFKAALEKAKNLG